MRAGPSPERSYAIVVPSWEITVFMASLLSVVSLGMVWSDRGWRGLVDRGLRVRAFGGDFAAGPYVAQRGHHQHRHPEQQYGADTCRDVHAVGEGLPGRGQLGRC